MKRQVKEKADARITQPKLIKQYNLGMGGVDVMDRLLGTYRPMIRGKKWYWPLVVNAINVSVVAAWRIHCNAVVSPMTHLEFCREIAICLLKSPMEERTKVTGGTLPSLPKDIRFDQINHYKITTTQGRCKICQKNRRYKSQKCNVRLHSDKSAVCFDCIIEIRNQWTFMSHVQQMWLFDFKTLFSRKWLALIFEFVNFLLVFKNIFWCIYKFSPSENKFYNFNNILVKSTHLWLLLITFIKLVKL